MFKKIIITFVILFAICITSTTHAEEVTFTQTANSDNITTGYQLYQNSGSNMVTEVNDSQLAQITVDVDMISGCNAFYIVAIAMEDNKTVKSEPSDIAIQCPPRISIPIVIGFEGNSSN